MYYDIHNHLFNKHFLAKELLYRLMKEMRNQLGIDGVRSRGEAGTSRGLKSSIRTLRRYTHAIRIFGKRNSAAIFEVLDKTYRGEFILTPLTFDLTWCFAPTADREMAPSPETTATRDFKRESDHYFRSVESRLKAFPGMEKPEDGEVAMLLEKYKKEKERFLEAAGAMLEAERSVTLLPDSEWGWKEQIRQLEEMKENPRYRNRIFPFLAVDPRRAGILEYAREHVGRGRLFAGIKLYCPNGYSPTDPLLFGHDGHRDGIYAFCEDNGIPITAHNSLGGFATFAKSVVVTGDIYKEGKLIPINEETVKFRDSFFGSEGVYERAMTLNHPMIWEKVVNHYPGLILNLAHFGGAAELSKALDNPGDSSLWSGRIIALLRDKGTHVFTDLSCFTEFRTLHKLINSPLYPLIRHRILFGSDYTLLLLFENNFNANIKKFKEYFGGDFGIIAGENPQEFLRQVV